MYQWMGKSSNISDVLTHSCKVQKEQDHYHLVQKSLKLHDRNIHFLINRDSTRVAYFTDKNRTVLDRIGENIEAVQLAFCSKTIGQAHKSSNTFF